MDQVTIHHPVTGATTKVAASVADVLAKHGWSRVVEVDTEAPTGAEDELVTDALGTDPSPEGTTDPSNEEE